MILPFLLLAGKLLSGAAAATVVIGATLIAMAFVVDSLRQHKVHDKDIGELIKEHMANGKVRVVGSVLSKRPMGIMPRKVRHHETFTGKLDPELEALFGNKDRIRVTL